MLRRIVVTCSTCLALVASISAQTDEYHFTAHQRSAVDQLLRDSLHSRLATTSDCTNSMLAEYRKGNPTYQPYFCEGDFDNNGKTDFVVAVHTDNQFDLFLFRATNSTYRKPEWFASLAWLPECGLFNANGRLQVMKFYSDDGVTFAWDKKTTKFSRISDED